MKRALRHPLCVVGSVLVLAVLVAALLAPVLSPHDPLAQDLALGASPPSWSHPLGTDALGRDLGSRVLWGARQSGAVALRAVFLSLVLGVVLGAVAGLFGGWPDLVLMRIVDIWMAFPGILLAMVLLTILERTPANVALAVGLVGVPAFARQARAGVLGERGRDYVTASRALGAGRLRLLLAVIGPNCAGPIIVLASLGLAGAILDAAGLAFLGLGGEPDVPEWGRMLADGLEHYRSAPWVVIVPGAALSLTVLGFNLLGDGLRDLWDPRLRSS